MTPTLLPFGFGELDWEDWIRGLLAAFIGGGATAVTSGTVVALKDPEHYAFGSLNFLQMVGAVFMASGVINGMMFLRNKPLPDKKVVIATIETTKQGKAPVKVVTTVQETHVEPLEKGPDIK